MRIPSTLATFAAAAALAALPFAAAAQHDHGGGDGSHESGGQPENAGADHQHGHGGMHGMHAAAGGHASHGAKPAAQVVAIDVTGDGFVPARAAVKAGQPVTLVVTRKTDRTCATDIVIKEYGISRPLPLNQAVEVRFTPKKAGPVRYACAMDMVAGTLAVE